MDQGGNIVALFALHINCVISKSKRSSRKVMVHAISLNNNSSSDKGCGEHLAEGEKLLVIKKIANVKTNKSIAERINRCVMIEIMTEIGESVRIFEKFYKEDISVYGLLRLKPGAREDR